MTGDTSPCGVQMSKRLSNQDLMEAWLAVQEGDEFFLDDEVDGSLHVRRDCPRLGEPVTIVTVRNGLLVDKRGFFFRHLCPCDMCIKAICLSTELECKP